MKCTTIIIISITIYIIIFENKQDLFNRLELCGSKKPENSEQHEYLSKVLNPENYDMSWFVKQAKLLVIDKLEKDMNINCRVEKIKIDSKCIQNIKYFNLGTEKFLNSVHKITINYDIKK